MDVDLVIAGVLCLVLALGHLTIGLVWVLPGITERQVPKTPFGPPIFTIAIVRVTWYIVTVFVLSLGGLLIAMGWTPAADSRALLLGWFTIMWLCAVLMAFYVARRSLHYILRLPVPFVWVAVAVLLWKASQ